MQSEFQFATCYREDIVRVGLCLPKTTTQFQVKSDFPVVIKNDHIMTSSLAALDADSTGKAFYFDKTTGLDTQQCVYTRTFTNANKVPHTDETHTQTHMSTPFVTRSKKK